MRSERLFRALSDVGEDLIARADAPVERQRVPWGRWAGLAACCALVVGLAALALPQLGLGAKSAAPDAAQGIMAQDAACTAGPETPRAAPEEGEYKMESSIEAPAEQALEPPAEEPEAEPAEEPAPEAEPAEAPAPEMPEHDEKNVLTGTEPGLMEPARTDDPKMDGGLLTEYEFTSAALQLSGADAPVTVTGEALTALLEQLRALPTGGAGSEQAGVAPMTLRLYEHDRLLVVVTLPCFSVSGAEDAAQTGCLSEASQALYEQLVKDWFADQ